MVTWEHNQETGSAERGNIFRHKTCIWCPDTREAAQHFPFTLYSPELCCIFIPTTKTHVTSNKTLGNNGSLSKDLWTQRVQMKAYVSVHYGHLCKLLVSAWIIIFTTVKCIWGGWNHINYFYLLIFSYRHLWGGTCLSFFFSKGHPPSDVT